MFLAVRQETTYLRGINFYNMAEKILTNETKEDEIVVSGDPNAAIISGRTFIDSGGGLQSTSGGAPTVRVYTANDVWTKPAGLSHVVVEVQAGGGGGGGNTAINRGGGGGGGGGYSRKFIKAADLGVTETVTVGAGGAGATAGTGLTGNSSSFGAHLSATGGVGGQSGASVSPGGAGGVGSSGDVNIEGGDGSYGSGGATANMALGGAGGNSALGGGAGNVISTLAIQGVAGNLYGGGGSGSSNNDNTDTTGGAGGAGTVIVYEY
jgi:hypothetical protein